MYYYIASYDATNTLKKEEILVRELTLEKAAHTAMLWSVSHTIQEIAIILKRVLELKRDVSTQSVYHYLRIAKENGWVDDEGTVYYQAIPEDIRPPVRKRRGRVE